MFRLAVLGWVGLTLAACGASSNPNNPPAAPGSGATLVQYVIVPNADFDAWVAGFRARAAAAGIGAGTLDAALADVGFIPEVIEKDRNQSEFTKPIWEYLDTAVSDSRIANGQQALRDHAATLAAIEARYGVDRHVVVAVWGLESAYGARRGDVPIISALATLAFEGRRAAFFEDQLIAALRILQSGDTTADRMVGSWAGAMGHTQFIPTSYLAYAVDFDGDGRRDIWGDDPADALASTAAYLANFGWRQGQPWGVEVQLPRNFDYQIAREANRQTTGAWATLGVRGIDGRPVPDYGPAELLLPAGANGAAFLIFRNFNVIERYNTADAYVIGVGHLADRLRGGPPIQGGWPRGDRALSFAERQEMQRLLTARGFDTLGVDGLIGPRTIAAIRAFQQSVGVTPDGYASLSLLERLR
jgi:membrane-bound lytic murein transglycosylase B